MQSLKKRGTPDRSKININDPLEVKYWTKELGVDKDQLKILVERTGNSARAIRKELGLLETPN
jgi:Protein of unknown function (DUF3606)